MGEGPDDVESLFEAAHRIASRYVAGLREAGSPFVADETGERARHSAAVRVSLGVMSRLLPDADLPDPGLPDPGRFDAGHDTQPLFAPEELVGGRIDHEAAVSAIFLFLATARPIIRDATGLHYSVVERELSDWIVPRIAAAHTSARANAMASLAREDVHEVVDRNRARELRLTAREAEILTCIAAGESNRAIAETMSITEQSVKNGVSRIGKKLLVSGRASILNAARAAGVLVIVYLAAGGTIPGITDGS